jgi:hypothetical protein
MTFPTYHLYVAVISQRDQAVLILAILAMVALELLLFIRWLRPSWLRGAVWVLIGGFYASQIALAVYLRAGA